jgi:hypothetical protein
MEDHPDRKHVADRVGFGGHVDDVDDFGGDEPGRAATYEQVLLGVGVRGEAEIGDDDLVEGQAAED